MDKHSIDRINELSAISKQRPLTEEEANERHALRENYLKAFRANFKTQLDNTVIQYEDGTKQALKDLRGKEKK